MLAISQKPEEIKVYRVLLFLHRNQVNEFKKSQTFPNAMKLFMHSCKKIILPPHIVCLIFHFGKSENILHYKRTMGTFLITFLIATEPSLQLLYPWTPEHIRYDFLHLIGIYKE
jgi:hypothetical protein